MTSKKKDLKNFYSTFCYQKYVESCEMLLLFFDRTFENLPQNVADVNCSVKRSETFYGDLQARLL